MGLLDFLGLAGLSTSAIGAPGGPPQSPDPMAATYAGLTQAGVGLLSQPGWGPGLGQALSGFSQGSQNYRRNALDEKLIKLRMDEYEATHERLKREDEAQQAQAKAIQDAIASGDLTPQQAAMAQAFPEKWAATQFQSPKDPYSTAGKLAADLKAGNITQAEHDAALKKENYIAYPQPQQPNEMQTRFSLAKQAWAAQGGQGMPDLKTLQQYGVAPAPAQTAEQLALTPDPNSPTGMSYAQKAPGVPGIPPAMATIIEKQKLTKEALAANQKVTAPIVLDDIQRAKKLADNWTTGFVGHYAQAIPGTDANNLHELLAGIGSNITIDKLQQMRAMSPTGGALGQVSNYEDQMLRSAYGSLEQSQSKEQFTYNLDRLEKMYDAIVNGPSGGASASPTIPKIGTVEDGFMFKGGDPADKSSWVPAP